jgi:hypothetical protein
MQIVDIDRAGRLYDRMAVARVAAGSVIVAVGLFFVGVGIQQIKGGYALPVLGSFLLERLPWVALMVLIAYGAFWPSAPLARLGLLGLAAYAGSWMFQAGGQVWLVHDLSELWQAAAIFRLVVVTWVALEVIVAVWPAFFAKRTALAILQEPSGMRAMFGLPSTLRYLTAGRRVTAAMFMAAAFLFSLGVQQTTGLTTSADVHWDIAVEACQGHTGLAARRACLETFGWAEAFGQFVVWPLTFVIAVAVGRWLLRRARLSARDNAAAAMKALDTGKPDAAFKPILFLRTFTDDQVKLPDARPTPLGWLFGFVRGAPPLDHLLVEEFALYGPTIALAKAYDAAPGQTVHLVPDHGVTRYLTTHATWEAEVTRLAAAATAIVMVCDDQATDGVEWELKHVERITVISARRSIWLRPRARTALAMRPCGPGSVRSIPATQRFRAASVTPACSPHSWVLTVLPVWRPQCALRGATTTWPCAGSFVFDLQQIQRPDRQ